MSSVLVVTWDGAGNLVPTLGIAERLVRAGHDVRILGHAAIDRRCADGGWRFQPLEHTSFDSTEPLDLVNEMTVLGQGLWFNPEVGTEVLAELEREPADVVLADCMLAGALSAGQALGMPTVALFHTPISGFRGGPLVDLMAPSVPFINAFRQQHGLDAVTSLSEVHDGCDLSLVSTPREFDVEVPLPGNVAFVGPVLDGPAINRQPVELGVEDGPEPLVLVSFSSGFQGQVGAIQQAVDALAPLSARVVVTTGSAVAPEALTPHANTTVAGFVPHDRVLPRASVVVTHGGLGTVLNALAHGVPLVCRPMGRDQFFNAAMVERLGVGRMVPPDVDHDTLRTTVEAVIADDGTREAAKAMAGTIAGCGGADEAVRQLERLAPVRG